MNTKLLDTAICVKADLARVENDIIEDVPFLILHKHMAALARSLSDFRSEVEGVGGHNTGHSDLSAVRRR